MKPVIVHIGWEKTGSTSLQAFLSKNFGVHQNADFYYPNDNSLAFVAGNMHSPLVGAVMGQNKLREFIPEHKQIDGQAILSDFVSHLQGVNKTIVVSCEHFSSRVSSEEEMKRLKGSIEDTGRKVKIVCYIRDPVNLSISAYTEGIKAGYRNKLSWDYVNPQNEYYNPIYRLRRWANVFGSENVTVREFHQDKLFSGDICSDFCDLLGVNSKDMVAVNRLNTSLPPDNIEVLRRCNFFWPTLEEDMASWRRAFEARVILREASPKTEGVEYKFSAPADVIGRFSEARDEIQSEFLSSGLSEAWSKTKQSPENLSDKHIQETTSNLEDLAAEWLVSLADKSQQLRHERDKALSERDKALSERDKARRYPWKYLKYAAQLRIRDRR